MITDVTVVIATHDRPDWLATCIRGVQLSAEVARSRDISTRILVVDDGSHDDRSRRVCDALAVSYLRNPFPDGRNDPSAARVFGLEHVDSEAHVFFDDDDVMLPRFLSLHGEALHEDYDIAYSPFWVTDADLRAVRCQRHLPVRLGDLLADHCMVNDHCMVRTAVARDVWDPTLEKAMPFGAWLELAFRGRSFVQLREPTYLYRRHSANMSTSAATDPRMVQLRTQLLERYAALV
ncbi:MAG: glycosyltransferase family 2 protein, partial [Acidimicrobiia bacterium]